MDDTLSAEQIQRITGYKRPCDQLRELHLQGFYRARRAKVTGEVILERPHYDAVAGGHQPDTQPGRFQQTRAPQLRAVK